MNGEPREVTDADAIDGAVAVVCTSSGGAQSVRLELRPDWGKLPEAVLLAAIADARVSPSGPEQR